MRRETGRKREKERENKSCVFVRVLYAYTVCVCVSVVVPVLSYYTNTDVFPGFELRWVRRLKLGREMFGRNLCRNG